MDLHARFDVEIVADIAVLKIKLEQADESAAGCLRGPELVAISWLKKIKKSESRYSVAIATMRSSGSGAFSSTGNRMQESSPSVGRRETALVISSMRLTACKSGTLARIRRSRSLSRSEST